MLSMQYSRKPGKYWDNFAHVETELLDFIEEHGTHGIMPIEKELLRAGRGDLAKAIRKHKGVETVAQRLRLQLPPHKRKRHGYWEDFVNIERELLAFVSEYGTPGVMPSRNDLRQAGLHDLNGALKKHGGTSAVARRLNLQPKIKPIGHWDDITNIEKALSAYIDEYGTSGVMPTLSE